MSVTPEPTLTVEGLEPLPPEPAAPPAAAPEPPEPAPSGKKRPDRAPTWEEVEAARQEEKNKLYPRLTKAEEELQALRQKEADAEKAAKKAAKEAEEARLAAERERMSAQELIESYRAEQEQKFAELQAELETERALRQREREWGDLMQYKAARMQEVGDEIMPELHDIVTGNTREEIDASIERAIAKTNAILGNVQQQLQGIRSGMPGVAPTGAPATGPVGMDGTGQVITAEDIRNMSAEEYAANRDALQAAVRRSRR